MKEKTINIYIPKDQRKKIDELKVKYRLSLTTIVDILVFTTWKYLRGDQIETLTKTYIYKKGAKTSVKMPKIFSQLIWNESVKKQRLATNVLMIYLNKDIKKYVADDKVNKYYNDLNNKMTTTVDEFWDYNQFIKKQRRLLRENPNLEYKDGNKNG